MRIPLLDLKREYFFLKKPIARAVKECFLSQNWILGKKGKKFEVKVANFLKTKYAIGTASGTDSLLLSLKALSIKLKKKEFFSKRDEIITTPFTFIATAEAIVRSGATPVFVDIDPDTFNINHYAIKKAITKNTVGILPVHLYGLAADMKEISKIAKENNLFTLEDAAQGFGGKLGKKKVGSFGDAGAFSFFPSKNLGGYGDGGIITTNDYKLAEIVKMLRNHGEKKRYQAEYIGYNSRLDDIQAAILTEKIKYIEKFNLLRRKTAHIYNNNFKSLTGVETPYEPNNYYHIFHLYTLKVSAKKRGKLLKYLNSSGIGARVYYPFPIYKMKPYKNIVKINGTFHGLKKVMPQILSIPIHPFLKQEEIHYITARINRFFRENL